MSGNGNNGSCNGGGSACPNWNLSQAKFGGAFEFDSSNDYIALPQSLLNGVSRGTISIWYNRHTFTGTTADNFPIFAYGGQDTDEYMIIYVDTDSGTFVFRKDAGLTNANFICPDKNFTNIWTNIFVTWDNSQMQCFINGVFTNSLSGDFEPGISQDTRLAGISNRVDYDFDGLLDEVAIWNRSLSSKEIHDMYNLNYRRYYWKANATDLAGNVNNTAIQEFNITLPPANANTTLRPVNPYKTNNLNCSFTFTDPNPDDPGTGTIIFYNQSREHFRTNISISAPGNNTVVSYQLTNNQTNTFVPGSNITCAARTNDLMINSEAWVNSSVIINQSLNTTLLQLANITSRINNSAELNISIEVGENKVTELIIYAGNTTSLDYNNIIYRNTSITNFSEYNITYNFTALPIKPDGTEGLVLLYHFDNITNFENASTSTKFNVYDWSSNGNNGTGIINSGGPILNLTQGKFGGAFTFDGATDIINISNGVEPTLLFMSSWIRTTATSFNRAGPAPVIGNYGAAGGFEMSTQTTGNVYCLWRTNSGTNFVQLASTGTINDGNWHNIACNYDNSATITIYIDGKIDTSGNTWGGSGTWTKRGTSVAIGANAISTSDSEYNGTIDEVAIWNRSLSSKEIADMYNLNYRRYYWKANATDLAGNVNNTAIQEFNITLPPANANTTLRPTNPYKTNNLNCSFTFIDPNTDDPGIGTIIFYNSSREHFRTNISIAQGNSNNTIVSYTLLNNQTNTFVPGSNITCAARTNDLMINSESWVNASVVINNSLPHNPQPF